MLVAAACCLLFVVAVVVVVVVRCSLFVDCCCLPQSHATINKAAFFGGVGGFRISFRFRFQDVR